MARFLKVKGHRCLLALASANVQLAGLFRGQMTENLPKLAPLGYKLFKLPCEAQTLMRMLSS